jgi:hypothetical protein
MSVQSIRAAILDRARRLITGQRQADYGPPSENFARIATIWSVILQTSIRPDQVALCMAGLKLARLAQGPHADSYDDLCGYGALAGELSGIAFPDADAQEAA